MQFLTDQLLVSVAGFGLGSLCGYGWAKLYCINNHHEESDR